MRPAATVSCPECDESWPARTSRFCGRCGDALAPAEVGPRRRRPRSTAAAGGILIAVGLLAALGAGGSVLADALAARPQAAVDLPRSRELTEQRGLTGADARAALAPFDEDRLRCEPDGCERWRLHLTGGIDHVSRLGDLMVFQVDRELVAVDVRSGERAWTAPLSVPTGERLAPRGLDDSRLIASSDELLVVARETGDLRVLDHNGRHRWRTNAQDPAWIWDVQVVRDVVVTVGPPPSPSDGSVALHAFDLRDGSPRWTTIVREHLSHEDQMLVRTEDGVYAQLDPSDGEVAASYPHATWAHLLDGGLLLVGDDHGRSTVIDGTSGTHLLELEGRHLGAILVDGPIAFLQILADGSETEQEVLAVTLDGEQRWRRMLDLPHRCCLTLHPADDGALFVRDPEGAGRLLDAETGADRPHRDPPPIPPGEWWTGHVSLTDGPDGHTIVAGRDGSARVISDHGWLLQDDPVVFASRDTLLGVDLVAPPVGPRPVTRLPAA